jgi:hypothetical protein
MRTLLLSLLLALLTNLTTYAQDLLTKRNGDELLVKVIEITPSEIKYRRADNLDGPLISLWKSDVFMIRYANGTKEVLGNSLPVAAPSYQLPVAAPKPARSTPPTTPPAPIPVPALRNATVTTTTGAAPTGPPVPGDAAILPETIHLDGPRIGFTVLSGGVVNKASENGVSISNFITQFGWQFETRLFRMPNGFSGVAEFVPLVGGLDQGVFLPSLSGVLGLRGAKGFEFGVGPNVTPLGASLVLALGTSFSSNGINFPVNLAVVPGRDGVRASLLLGFNARRR